MEVARPLRVLLMAGSLEIGGSEQQTALLLRHLDRRLFTPYLYLTYRRGDLLDMVPKDVVIDAFSDMAFHPRLNWPGRWHGKMVSHLRRLLAKNQIDVVYDRTFHMTLIAGPACGNQTRRVSTIVCPPDEDLMRNESRFLATKRRRLAKAYRRSSRVITVSEAVRTSAINYYGLEPQTVTTIRSPVDVTHLRSLSQSDIAFTLQSDELNLVCIGRMTAEKGHDILLNALARLRATKGQESVARLKLWLVGDGPLRSQYESMVDQLGLQQHVVFTGRLANVPSFLARCQCLICPSRYEGLPNVILEAFALGVPVIAAESGGIPELVKHNSTGRLFPSENVEALAVEMARFAANRDDFKALSARAFAMTKQDFDVEVYLDKIQSELTRAGYSGPKS